MKPTLSSTTLLDRQSQKRGDAAYLAALVERADVRFLVLVDHKPVIHSNDDRTEASIRWLTTQELAKTGLDCSDPLFLGTDRVTGAGRFAVSFVEHRVKACNVALGMFRPVFDLRTLAMQGVMSSEEVSLCGMAKALAHWHDNARCCGRCGGITRTKDGGWRRRCWACGHEWFPRTDPVVIMLVSHPEGHSCLLGRSGRFQANMFSTLAGFLEPGEDIEDAVRREVKEEAGIDVGDVRFHSAQPWPFPHSLMIGCLAEALGSDLVIDEDELVEARWFSREEARSMLDGTHPDGLFGPGRQAIARALITTFVESGA
jgi:NAD+ diphosphatase